MSRQAFFQACNATTEHQRRAGIASWAAFSARWRSHQGLPLLHPMDVQYLTPDDFCSGSGRPLSPVEQRRLFRWYVQQAIEQAAVAQGRMQLARRAGLVSGDLAFVRLAGFFHQETVRREMLYGRDDLSPWDEENLSPRRPYGIPVSYPGAAPQAYWIDPALAPPSDDEDW